MKISIHYNQPVINSPQLDINAIKTSMMQQPKDFSYSDVTSKELLEDICNSKSICAGKFKNGYIVNNNLINSRVLIADIDDGLSYNDFTAMKCFDYVSITYPTFSDGKNGKDKYRAVFALSDDLFPEDMLKYDYSLLKDAITAYIEDIWSSLGLLDYIDHNASTKLAQRYTGAYKTNIYETLQNKTIKDKFYYNEDDTVLDISAFKDKWNKGYYVMNSGSSRHIINQKTNMVKYQISNAKTQFRYNSYNATGISVLSPSVVNKSLDELLVIYKNNNKLKRISALQNTYIPGQKNSALIKWVTRNCYEGYDQSEQMQMFIDAGFTPDDHYNSVIFNNASYISSKLQIDSFQTPWGLEAKRQYDIIQLEDFGNNFNINSNHSVKKINTVKVGNKVYMDDNTLVDAVKNEGEDKFIIIKATQGLGKNYNIKKLHEAGYKIIYVTHRVALVSSMANMLGIMSYDQVFASDKTYQDFNDSISITIQSLHKLNIDNYGKDTVLIIDEWTQMTKDIRAIVRGDNRFEYMENISKIFQTVGTIVLSDSDYSDDAFNVYNSFNGFKYDIAKYECDYYPKKNIKRFIARDEIIYDIAKSLIEDERVVVPISKRDDADGWFNMLQNINEEMMSLGSSLDDKKIKIVLGDKTIFIKENNRSFGKASFGKHSLLNDSDYYAKEIQDELDVDLLLYTSCMYTGVSIDNHNFDKVRAIFSQSQDLTAPDIIQAFQRARNLTDYGFFIKSDDVTEGINEASLVSDSYLTIDLVRGVHSDYHPILEALLDNESMRVYESYIVDHSLSEICSVRNYTYKLIFDGSKTTVYKPDTKKRDYFYHIGYQLEKETDDSWILRLPSHRSSNHVRAKRKMNVVDFIQDGFNDIFQPIDKKLFVNNNLLHQPYEIHYIELELKKDINKAVADTIEEDILKLVDNNKYNEILGKYKRSIVAQVLVDNGYNKIIGKKLLKDVEHVVDEVKRLSKLYNNNINKTRAFKSLKTKEEQDMFIKIELLFKIKEYKNNGSLSFDVNSKGSIKYITLDDKVVKFVKRILNKRKMYNPLIDDKTDFGKVIAKKVNKILKEFYIKTKDFL